MLLPCQTEMIQINLVFSMAVEQQLKAMLLPRAAAQNVRIPGPPIIALAVVNKSLAVFITKYVLSGLYRENCRGSVCRLGSRMPVMFGNV